MSKFPAMLRKFTILICRNYVCMPFSHHITHLFILKGGVSIYGDDAKENGDFQKKETAFAAVQQINEVRVKFDNHTLDDFKKRNEHLRGLCNRK